MTSVPPLLGDEPPTVTIDAPIDLGTIAFRELIVRGSLCSDDGDRQANR